MELTLTVFLLLLAIGNAKASDLTSLCEKRENGVFALGHCQADFVVCMNAAEHRSLCQPGFLFDPTDGFCKTPHEHFCSDFIADNAERECQNDDKVDDHLAFSKISAAPVADEPLRAAAFPHHEDFYTASRIEPKTSEHPHASAQLSNKLIDGDDHHALSSKMGVTTVADEPLRAAPFYRQEDLYTVSHMEQKTSEHPLASAQLSNKVIDSDDHLLSSKMGDSTVAEEPLRAAAFPHHEDLYTVSHMEPKTSEHPHASAQLSDKLIDDDDHFLSSKMGAATVAEEPLRAAPFPHHEDLYTVSRMDPKTPEHLHTSAQFSNKLIDGDDHLLSSKMGVSTVAEEPLRAAAFPHHEDIYTVSHMEPKTSEHPHASAQLSDKLIDDDDHLLSSKMSAATVAEEPLKAAAFPHHEDLYTVSRMEQKTSEHPHASAQLSDKLIDDDDHLLSSKMDVAAVADEPLRAAAFPHHEDLYTVSHMEPKTSEEPHTSLHFSNKSIDGHVLSSKVGVATVAEEPLRTTSFHRQEDQLERPAVSTFKALKRVYPIGADRSPLVLNNPFALNSLHDSFNRGDQQDLPTISPFKASKKSYLIASNGLRDGFNRGDQLELPAVSPFKASKRAYSVRDKFEGDMLPLVVNNPFAHFPEKEPVKYKYERNVDVDDEGSASSMDEDDDIELFWRKKRSLSHQLCPVKRLAYRPMLPNLYSSSKVVIPHIRDGGASPPVSLRDLFGTAPDAVVADPACYGREDGHTYSNGICRSLFYKCSKGRNVRHYCSQNRVYSERKKMCVSRADLVECRPSKSQDSVITSSLDSSKFCRKRSDGFYRNPQSCQRIVQCFDSVAFEYPSCDLDLAFDERRGVCDYRQNVPGCGTFGNKTSTSEHLSVIGCGSYNHGDHIPNEKDCNSFYRCVWNTMELMKCPTGTVFNPKLDVCDYPNQVQCSLTN